MGMNELALARALILIVAVAACLGDVPDYFANIHAGQSIKYNPTLVRGGEGLCGLTQTGQFSSLAYVSGTAAMSSSQYAHAGTCGMCVELIGTGLQGQTGSNESQIVMVTDSCPLGSDEMCEDGNLYLANDHGSWTTVSEVEWRAVSCPGEIGPLQYYLQNSNEWRINLQIRNHRVPIRSVEVAVDDFSALIPRTDKNFFTWRMSRGVKSLNGSIELTITSYDGQILTDVIPTTLLDSKSRNIGPINGAQQFSEWQESSANPLGTPPTVDDFFVPSTVLDLYGQEQSGEVHPAPIEMQCPLPPSDWGLVAVSSTNFFHGQSCGICVQITDADGQLHTGKVSGVCHDCVGGSIQMQGADLREPVQWKAIPCPSVPVSYQLITHGLQYGNIQVQNALLPISEVYVHTLDGRTQAPPSLRKDGTYMMYFASDTDFPLPEMVQVEVCAVNGECIIDRVDVTALLSGEVVHGSRGVQFSPWDESTLAMSSPLGSGIPDYREDYISIIPSSSNNQLIFHSNGVEMDGPGDWWVMLNGTENQMSQWMTTYQFHVKGQSKIFKISMREAPVEYSSDPAEALAWRITGSEDGDGEVSIASSRDQPGVSASKSHGKALFPQEDGVDITVKMSLDYSSQSITSSLQWTVDGEEQYFEEEWIRGREHFPSLGALGFVHENWDLYTPTTVSEIRVSTSIVCQVEFSEPVDFQSLPWDSRFFRFTGIDPWTTQIRVLDSREEVPHENEKFLRKILTFVITSTQGTASTKAQKFLILANGAPGRANNIVSAFVLPSNIGAEKAGFPVNANHHSDGFDWDIITALVVGAVYTTFLVAIIVILVSAVVLGIRFVLRRRLSTHSPLPMDEDLELGILEDISE